MRFKTLLVAARVVFAATALTFGMAAAQAEPFDGKKFFEKLSAEGASMPKDFDSK